MKKAFKPEKQKCPFSGKTMLDKKGAITLKNLTLRLHNIKMREYECPYCFAWHLATTDEKRKRKFRHHLFKGVST